MNFTLLYPNFKSKAVTFSYDDGVIQDRRLITILKEHPSSRTFNLKPMARGPESAKQIS